MTVITVKVVLRDTYLGHSNSLFAYRCHPTCDVVRASHSTHKRCIEQTAQISDVIIFEAIPLKIFMTMFCSRRVYWV
jgi:hypothetical protein